MTKVADGLEWRRVYWVDGRTATLEVRPEVDDPPCAGWQHAFVLPGERRSTIFCPYSVRSWQVSNGAAELTTSIESSEWRRDAVVGIIHRGWTAAQRLGLGADLDTAALVLRRLGAEVPTRILDAEGKEDTRERGGKPAAEQVLKPVRPAGKRGRFLQWFLDGDRSTRSVRETMAELGMTRSNVLSYLFAINRDHGVGYSLVGDAATLDVPAGDLWEPAP